MIECGQTLKIANDDLVIYETRSQYASHGELVRSFQSTDNSEFFLVFQDLSLHYIQGGKKMWDMEQALSKVVQVEIFDSASLSEFRQADMKYVEKMSEPVAWYQIPARIMERYLENAEFLVKSISQIFGSQDVTSINNQQDTYGFKKTLVLLTAPGKLFALSSSDGALQWSYYNPQEPIVKVFVEQAAGSDLSLNIIVITERNELHLNPLTGTQYSRKAHHLDTRDYEFMLVRSGPESQNVIAVPKGAQATEQILKLTDGSSGSLAGDQPLFYT